MRRSTSVLLPIDIYQGKDQFHGRFGADDEYAGQATHSSDKGFTTNKLATQWLEGYLDARRATSVFGYGVLQMASGPDRHQADYGIGFVRYPEWIISRTYRNHFLQVRSRSDSIIALIRSVWLSLQTEVLTARADIAGAATPRSKYAGREAGAGPGGWKELIGENIGDWKLLKLR